MPPLFFDVMAHLVVHLVEELDLCSLVHTWWMYCIERMNKVFKGYVWCILLRSFICVIQSTIDGCIA
jgi:hypothetical protein